jgi:folate-binding protein YgfZ
VIRTANDYGYHGAMDTLTSTVTVIDRPDLATVALAGNDVLRYLHAVCSQHTLDLVPGDATQALLLTPKGKIEFAFRLAVLDHGALLDTEAEAAPGLAERLARFVFRYDVTVGQPAQGAATLLGPGADAALAAAGLPVPGAGRAGLAGPDLVVQRTPAGIDLVGPAAPAAAAGLERAGAERAPAERWEQVRVEHGLPRPGRELTDDVLAEEAGLLGSHVHLDKGCYPGQETVARVHNLGQVQRRLAGLRFEPPADGGQGRSLHPEPASGDGAGAGLPAPRTELVTDDGRRAGQLRSVVDHPRLGPIGLAYVRRVVEDGRLVRAGDRVATVVDLPFR